MSSASAIIVVSLLYGAAIVPVLLIWGKPQTSALIAASCGAFVIGLAINQAGFFEIGTSIDAELVQVEREVQATQCSQAIALAVDAGIILDRTNPRRVIVDTTVWKELPKPVQEVLTACLEDTGAETGVEVIHAS